MAGSLLANPLGGRDAAAAIYLLTRNEEVTTN